MYSRSSSDKIENSKSGFYFGWDKSLLELYLLGLIIVLDIFELYSGHSNRQLIAYSSQIDL